VGQYSLSHFSEMRQKLIGSVSMPVEIAAPVKGHSNRMVRTPVLLFERLSFNWLPLMINKKLPTAVQ
jgi:hypothetical protein